MHHPPPPPPYLPRVRWLAALQGRRRPWTGFFLFHNKRRGITGGKAVSVDSFEARFESTFNFSRINVAKMYIRFIILTFAAFHYAMASCVPLIRVVVLGYPTIRPLSFRPRSFRPGHFVPWSFRPRSFCPLVISSPGHFVPSCCIIQINST
jgi:hypothetical protein